MANEIKDLIGLYKAVTKERYSMVAKADRENGTGFMVADIGILFHGRAVDIMNDGITEAEYINQWVKE